MKIEQVLKAAGKYKATKRRGKGNGSGQGGTAGRGHKGYKARAGSGALLGFEGGQNPILKRIPKRGFSNVQFRTVYQVVNVSDLNRFEDGQSVDPKALATVGLISDASAPVKILAGGELERKLTVVAGRFSAAAAEKIAKCGGKAEQA
jgi:large subunit ribosomal protein L15